jgi:hypothetical protein
MPHLDAPTLTWTPVTDVRARRLGKMAATAEFVLLHEDNQRFVYVWLDPFCNVFFREQAYQNRPSTWEEGALPPKIAAELRGPERP